ncbi:hypothetical protein [uncultured Paraglaciecola sp.]|uniref:hypothetical protein n=1 Tax=uncultured Paraglaciecola sp. TaxID=1765024 RepID=UPI0026312897|nr:hypothetical protein [uncultured Paraglaciecola sp.]
MAIKKELRDQSLHFVAGFGITWLLSLFMPVIAAALSVMSGAVLREKLQHRDKKLFELGKGSMLDLMFWALGISLAIGLKLSGVL